MIRKSEDLPEMRSEKWEMKNEKVKIEK